MKHSIKYVLFASLLFSFLNPVFAATAKKEKWYEVEVIIFTNHSENIQDLEKWPNKPDSPDTLKVLDLFSPTEILLDDVENIPLYYAEPLISNDNNLNYIAKKIEKSGDYSLIMHRVWRQTATRRKSLYPVYLDDAQSIDLYQPLGNEEFIEEELDEISAEQLLLNALIEEEISFTQPQVNLSTVLHPFDPIIPFDENGIKKSEPVDLTPMGPPNHALFGTLRLFKNRFLHVAVDFLYRTPPSIIADDSLSMETDASLDVNSEFENERGESESDEGMVQTDEEVLALNTQEKPPSIGFRHAASKRIRLKEVHFFDHPVFGVIVRVIRYVEPEPEEKPEQISRR